MNLAVVGLGKLGLPLALILANSGHSVTGIDNNKELVDKLNNRECPIYEADTEGLLANCNSRFNATTEIEKIRADFSFVIVPTPSDKYHKFSNEYLVKALENVAPIIMESRYHIVVIVCTVMPGTMANVVKPTLERLTGKKCGTDFGLCYNPEFVALGQVVKGLTQPDMLLIGAENAYDAKCLERLYSTVCINRPPVVNMSWWNAELAKISLNVFITTKISLINTIAMICNKIPGGNVEQIAELLGSDSRIGNKYLMSGLGFGGTCFPRDNRAFMSFAKEVNASYPIQEATDKLNDQIVTVVAKDIISLLGSTHNKAVSILGLTYKPETPVCEESKAIKLANILCKFVKVKACDPAGKENARKELNKKVAIANSIGECVKDTDLCIIAVSWEQFKYIHSSVFNLMKKPVIYDCWRILDSNKLAKSGIEYHALGINK